MTYCLGWKTKNGVVISADTALTSDIANAAPGLGPYTSFGEPNLRSGSEVVEERGLKIFRFENCLLGYAGLTRIAHGFTETLALELAKNTSPREAFKLSIGLRISLPVNLAFVFTFFEGDEARLLSFNSENDGKIVEHDELVQVGSVPAQFKEATRSFLKEIATEGNTLKNQTAELLGILHSYGGHAPLMLAGVGGAYSAGYLDVEGTHWQPDILYCISTKNIERQRIISTCARADCLLIDTSIEGASKCMANVPVAEMRSPKNVVLYRWAIKQSKDLGISRKYDHVTFLNGDVPTVVVVEMKKKHKHELLWIMPIFNGEGGGMSLHLDPELKTRRDNPIRDTSGQVIPTAHFLPYEKPSEGSIIKKSRESNQPKKWESSKDGRIDRSKY